MTSMTLDIKEVYALLRHLRKNGVLKFEGFGLKLELESETNAVSPQTVRQTKASATKAAEIEQLSFLKENADAVEDAISHALIEDPAEYERLLREGELEDARGETSQDRGLESALQ